MKRLCMAVVFVGFAGSAFAQGEPITWNLRIYEKGSTDAISIITVTREDVVCDQALPPGTTENPVRWVWTDTGTTGGKMCIYVDAARLLALPDGEYQGGITAVNEDGESVEGPLASFTRRRLHPPAPPLGLQLLN